MVISGTRPLQQSKLVAAILNAAISVTGLVVSIAPLPQGAEAVANSHDQPPFAALVVGVVLGVLGLVGSFGILRRERWGSILTIAVRGVDGLLSIAGVLFAESTTLRVLASVSVVGAVAVVALVLRRSTTPTVVVG